MRQLRNESEAVLVSRGLALQSEQKRSKPIAAGLSSTGMREDSMACGFAVPLFLSF